MTLERLRRLVAPPSPAPRGGGSPEQWRQVEAFLGLVLPQDYKALVDTFGCGQFVNFITVFTPFAHDESANLLAQPDLSLRAYQAVRAEFPEAAPYPAFPEPGGVLPWALTSNGDVLFWLTEGPSNTWPIIAVESRHGAIERHNLTTTDFLAQLLAGELPTRILPDDLNKKGGPRFAPLPVSEAHKEW
jgi:SUKH superfamily protein